MTSADLINEYPLTGFFVAIVLSIISYQDLLTALLLGFFGALGGYAFKLIRDVVIYYYKKHS